MKNTELKTLGQTIRLKRENRGLTQNEVAEKAGFNEDELVFYGKYKAKLSKSVIELLRKIGALDSLNETDQLTFF